MLIQSGELFRKKSEEKHRYLEVLKNTGKWLHVVVAKEEDPEVAGCALLRYNAKIWRRIDDKKTKAQSCIIPLCLSVKYV
jgi:hypothetical protein